jgi:hypothetical protein
MNVLLAPWPGRPALRSVQPMRELDHRTNDGIEVTLLWNEHTETLTVAVEDHRSATSFEIQPPADHALRAFHHPYAYAA